MAAVTQIARKAYDATQETAACGRSSTPSEIFQHSGSRVKTLTLAD